VWQRALPFWIAGIVIVLLLLDELHSLQVFLAFIAPVFCLLLSSNLHFRPIIEGRCAPGAWLGAPRFHSCGSCFWVLAAYARADDGHIPSRELLFTQINRQMPWGRSREKKDIIVSSHTIKMGDRPQHSQTRAGCCSVWFRPLPLYFPHQPVIADTKRWRHHRWPPTLLLLCIHALHSRSVRARIRVDAALFVKTRRDERRRGMVASRANSTLMQSVQSVE